MEVLGLEQAISWRVRRHALEERLSGPELLDLVARLGGLHAQVMSSAELTAWARMEELDPDAVGRALWDERTLVKTWAMRGTLHLLPAAEYPLWQAGLSTFRHFLKPSWAKAFGLGQADVEEMIAGIRASLGGDPLTREALAAAVAEHTGHAHLAETLAGSWGSVLKPAAFRGALCFGPNAGRNVTFTRPDAWLGLDGATVDPDDAEREITRRFLSAYAPATREDLARWWGALSGAKAERRIRALGDEAVAVEVDGWSMWMLAADLDEARELPPATGVRLLPGFDQYVAVMPLQAPLHLPDPALKPRIHRPQGWISPVLLVGGRFEGVWRHERKGKRLVVSIEPFRRQTARVRGAAESEAERLAAFLGGELEVSWA